MTKPLLVFDGECGFCRRWVLHWQRVTGDAVAYAPFQEVAGQFPQISLEQFQTSVYLIEPSGRVTSGAEAALRTLACAPGKSWMLQAYRRIPGVAPILEWGYRLIARHRQAAATITAWLWGAHAGPASYRVTRWVFLRLLGITYLIAFASLGSQVRGLVGEHGISPAGAFLSAARDHLGSAAYPLLPTLCWLNASDATLTGLCGLGAGLAILVILGMAPVPALIGSWASYLSLTVIGQEFLSFQWDTLLLETGVLAILFAPLPAVPQPLASKRWRGVQSPQPLAEEAPPSPAILWMLRWLLFRLTFSSGIVKLASGDPTWRNLTALRYHYETQPLPTWIGWYAHQMPAGFHVASCAVMFVIELGVPFLIFAPRRPRAVGCGAMIALQLLIALTGNYTFFNLLTIALCLLLLDDAMWLTLRGGPFRLAACKAPRRRVTRAEGVGASPSHDAARPWPRWIIAPVAAAILLLSLVPVLALFRGRLPVPRPLLDAYRWTAPFRVVNNYGLFAVMTTSRPAIVVEGSRDGIAWQAYEFRFKPGALTQRPRFVAPHQPRLDWQMWFAALSRYEATPWFPRFCERLLQGTPEVLTLLAENPFPDAPPRYLRAALYDYRFTDPATQREQGTWWRRSRLGLYHPVVSLSTFSTS